MARKIVSILLALLLLGVMCGLCLTFSQRMHWVGGRDLEITFHVTDTGQPVPGAKVEILREDVSFCSDRDKTPFTLVTDSAGIARHLCPNCTCFGTSGWSWTGRIDTFAIHILGWHVQVAAPGYSRSELLYLDTPEYQKEVQRGVEIARLAVPVPLRRLPHSKHAKAE